MVCSRRSFVDTSVRYVREALVDVVRIGERKIEASFSESVQAAYAKVLHRVVWTATMQCSSREEKTKPTMSGGELCGVETFGKPTTE